MLFPRLWRISTVEGAVLIVAAHRLCDALSIVEGGGKYEIEKAERMSFALDLIATPEATHDFTQSMCEQEGSDA
jgi:hypothetical protein